MKRISPERKAATLAKLLPPYSMTVAAVAQMEGISEATLYNWRNQAKAEGKPVPGHSKNSEQWSAGEVSKDLAAQTVGSCHKQWRISCSPALSIALPNRLFVRPGLPEL